MSGGQRKSQRWGSRNHKSLYFQVFIPPTWVKNLVIVVNNSMVLWSLSDWVHHTSQIRVILFTGGEARWPWHHKEEWVVSELALFVCWSLACAQTVMVLGGPFVVLEMWRGLNHMWGKHFDCCTQFSVRIGTLNGSTLLLAAGKWHLKLRLLRLYFLIHC